MLTVEQGDFLARGGELSKGTTADPTLGDELPGQWRYALVVRVTNAGRAPTMLLDVWLGGGAGDSAERPLFPGGVQQPTLMQIGENKLIRLGWFADGVVRKGYWDKREAPMLVIQARALFESADGARYSAGAAWLHADGGVKFQRFGGAELNYTQRPWADDGPQNLNPIGGAPF